MIKLFTIFMIVFCTSLTIAGGFTLWECNRCHQQYIGDNPPPFVKCPSTNNKQPHWWIKK